MATLNFVNEIMLDQTLPFRSENKVLRSNSKKIVNIKEYLQKNNTLEFGPEVESEF